MIGNTSRSVEVRRRFSVPAPLPVQAAWAHGSCVRRVVDEDHHRKSLLTRRGGGATSRIKPVALFQATATRSEGERSMTAQAASRYRETYPNWKADPEGFWARRRDGHRLDQASRSDVRRHAGAYGRWFPERCATPAGTRSTGTWPRGATQPAIIYDSPVTGDKEHDHLRRVAREVEALAAVLQDFGVAKGDRVIVYMPMIPEAIVAMLACARIGAIHSVVFGGFAAKELATRIDDAKPKLILTASCGIEPNRVVAYKPLLDEAISLSSSPPQAVVLLQRPQAQASMIEGRDHDWAAVADAPRRPGRQPPASPWPRPIRSTCSTRPARRASRRAWCATMAGTWSRSPGR